MTDLQKFADKTTIAHKPAVADGLSQSDDTDVAMPVRDTTTSNTEPHLSNDGTGAGSGESSGTSSGFGPASEQTQHDGTAAASTGEASADTPKPDQSTDTTRLDPTRYGDWEKNGRCIDF